MALLVGELYALLLLEKKAFTKGLAEAQAEAKAAGGGISSTLMSIGKVTAVGLTALVIGLGAVGIAAINASVDFQRGMANIQTLIGKGSAADKRIQELAQSVKDMSVSTGKSLSDLQRGLYDVIGTFTDTADSAKWLEVAAKAGAAGLSTTHDAIILLSAVTKAYGDTSLEAAQKASDLIFETANLGVTTFPEMAASMGKVLPIAAALKVKEEELFGAMAALTGVTGDTALVTTQLRSVMNAFLKPNTLMRKAIEETGYASGQALVESLGLSGALKVIGGTSVTAERGIAAVFGRVEALTAVLALSGAQADDWAWKTTAMYHAAGRAQRAFEIQQATVGAMMDRIGAAFGVMAVNIGEKLMPAVQAALGWLEKAMPTIQDIVLSAVDAIVSGIGVAVDVIGFIADKIATAWSVLGDLGLQGPIIEATLLVIAAGFVALGVAAAGAAVAVLAATWPILAVIVAIALGIKGLEIVMNHFGITFSDVFAWLGKTAKDFVQAFLSIVGSIVNLIAQIPGPLQDAANEWRRTLDQMHDDVGRWGEQVSNSGYDAAHHASQAIGDGLSEGVKDSDVYETYKKAGNKAGSGLIDELKKAVDAGVPVTEEDLKALGITADEALAAGIEVGAPAVQAATKSLVEQYGYSLRGVVQAAKNAGGAAMAEMAKAIQDHQNEPVEAFNTLKDMLKHAMEPAKEEARLLGIAMSKDLAKGLRSQDPAVRAQAIATQKLVIARLQELVDAGTPLGKKAMEQLRKGMKSKDKQIKDTATQIMKNVEKQIRDAKTKKAAEDAANKARQGLIARQKAFADAANALGKKGAAGLKNGFGQPTLRATIFLDMPDDLGSNRRGYASGSWKIPKNELAFLHAGEMVIPAAAAQRLRQDSVSPTFSGMQAMRPSVHTEFNITVNPGSDVSRQAAQRFGQNVLDVVAGGLREQRARGIS